MKDFNNDIISIQEFDDMKDDRNFIYELIDGEVCVSSKLTLIEKNIIFNIATEIQRYLRGKPYKTLNDVELELNNNIYVCDMCVVHSICDLNSRRLDVIPIIFVELLLQDKSFSEIEEKMLKLKYAGVDEYWLVNPKNKSISVFSYNKEIRMNYFFNGNIKSNVLIDLNMPLSDIFD